MTFIPFILGSVMVCAYKFFKPRNREIAEEIFSWFLFMTFIILPAVSTKVFNTFACRDFDGNYGSYLKADYSIDCNSTEHKFFSAYAIICIIVYPIGVPAMYYWLLRRVSDQLDPGQKAMVAQLGIKGAMRRAVEERTRLENDKGEKDLLALSFLYSAYEPKYWFFEIVETLRKLILTGGLIYLGPGTRFQIILSMVICLVSLRIFASMKVRAWIRL